MVRDLLLPARPSDPRRVRIGIGCLLIASALLVVCAALAMPEPYSWRTHSISESAAQGQSGAWVARLSFVLFGLAVLALALTSKSAWPRSAYGCHVAFAIAMLCVAAFSHAPWSSATPGDGMEDLLHSVAATGMGFAFALGVVARSLARTRRRGLRALDALALAAATLLPPLGVVVPETAGLLQRAMFSVAYLWYGVEALGPEGAGGSKPGRH